MWYCWRELRPKVLKNVDAILNYFSFEFTEKFQYDVSLTDCLSTRIWTLAPKAISESKTPGTSFGTTVCSWPHVQVLRSFSSFFMQIVWDENSFVLSNKRRKQQQQQQTSWQAKQNKNRRRAKVTYWNATQQSLRQKTKPQSTRQKFTKCFGFGDALLVFVLIIIIVLTIFHAFSSLLCI